MIDLQSIASEVKPLVLQAGDLILDAWNNNSFETTSKDERDVVTDTDVEVEKFLKKYLYNVLPQAGFILEEGKSDMLGEFNWAIDPIDGTKFFASKTPLFFTQVALLRNNEPVLGFVYEPISKQLFSAVQGKGAYLNDERIIAPKTPIQLNSSIVEFDTGMLAGKENHWKYSLIEKVCNVIYRPRFSSGYLTIYLATGAIDASINTELKNPLSIKNLVDISPHTIILEEAGFASKYIDFQGKSILLRAQKGLINQLGDLLSAH